MRVLCLATAGPHGVYAWLDMHPACGVWCGCQDAGAIPYCKTNVPQLLMLPESTNHIFGPALNPWNTKRSPGGSSGGTSGHTRPTNLKMDRLQ